MKKNTGTIWGELGYFASLGISVALAIFMGLFLGLWLDGKFNTSPVLMLIGLAVGIAAGFKNIYRASEKGKRY
jgi:ATP synthase protein I